MSTSDIEYLKHIRDEARFLGDSTKAVTIEEFVDDEVLKRACVRAIEVIGEAAKKISENFRSKHPTIEWKKMAGMRDRMIHDYLGVDYYIVFDVARNKAPQLLADIDRVIRSQKD